MSDHDDERVQQVIDALDPQPAHDVDWPVSRRQTLRALAAAGLLGAGSGSASGDSAGTVIADEASFSNYASEDVSDGWELTIDDDVFGLTESDKETIELPDGGVGEEVIMPDGVQVSEMIAPDGTVVFEHAIPDGVIDNFDEILYEEQDTNLSDNYSEAIDDFDFDTSESAPGTDSSRSLQGTNSDSVDSVIVSQSGLPNYPSQGDTFSFYSRSTGTSSTLMSFGVQGTDYDGRYVNNGYHVEFRWWNGDIAVGKDTTRVDLTSAGVDRDGTWWFGEITWGSDGEIVFEVWEADDISGSPEASLSFQDTDYDSGGVAWSCHNNRDSCWWDWSFIDD